MPITTSLSRNALAGLRATFGGWHAVAALASLIAFAWRVRQERRALMALTDRELKDIGLSRSLAHREAERPFFDVPWRYEP